MFLRCYGSLLYLSDLILILYFFISILSLWLCFPLCYIASFFVYSPMGWALFDCALPIRSLFLQSSLMSSVIVLMLSFACIAVCLLPSIFSVGLYLTSLCYCPFVRSRLLSVLPLLCCFVCIIHFSLASTFLVKTINLLCFSSRLLLTVTPLLLYVMAHIIIFSDSYFLYPSIPCLLFCPYSLLICPILT